MKLNRCHIVSSRDGLLSIVIASLLTAQRSTTAARGAARAASCCEPRCREARHRLVCSSHDTHDTRIAIEPGIARARANHSALIVDAIIVVV